MPKKLTINQKQFDADYAGIGYMGYLKAQILDGRPLSEIAPEAEGSDVILWDGDDRPVEFDGYTRLMRIERIDDVAVVIMLEHVETEQTEPNQSKQNESDQSEHSESSQPEQAE